MARHLWHRDFQWHARGVTVRQTGAFVPYGEIVSLLRWMRVYLALLPRRVFRMDRARFTIAGAPHTPRPWYLIWPVVILAGGRWVEAGEQADLVLHFEDSTRSGASPAEDRPVLNAACRDVSKSRVADVFEQIFGYALAIDPTHHSGLMVEKGEENGAHDGRIVEGPCARRKGRVYQRLVDNRMDDDRVEDLRCPTIRGEIAVVFRKRRPQKDRFANFNTQVVPDTPQAVFSDEERARISAFCSAMGLDWGGIDILRDRTDGRLYIVDVNKTDMGPPIAMSLRDQLTALHKLADLFAERLYTTDQHTAHRLPDQATGSGLAHDGGLTR